MASHPGPAIETSARQRSTADVEADQMVARVVWYYYVGHLTQHDIAGKLGLTRLRVNQIIGRARDDGSVRIEVTLPLAQCVAMEDALVRAFGLEEASVVPAVPGLADTQRVVGKAAGLMLERLLGDDQDIGIGWGRTLRATIDRLASRRFVKTRVVALMGGLTRGSGTSTFEVATYLADLLKADCYYMAAPIYCPSEDSRSVLLTHYGLADVMRRAREVSVALVSCGDLSEASLLASTSIVRENVGELVAAGAVGDLLGTFLRADGTAVEQPLNRRVMALAPRELAQVPVSILASGGTNKAPVVHGILKQGYVNRLVTDEACASRVLAMHRADTECTEETQHERPVSGN